MATPGSPRAADFASIASVKAAGPSTVVFRLKRQDSEFIGGNPYVLSPTQLAKLGDGFAANPVCVGPFMFDHRVVGDEVTLVKSPYYYDRSHVYLDKIVYRSMPDTAAAAAALEAGDVQALDGVATTELEGVEENASLRVLRAFQLGWKGLMINVGNENGVAVLPYANVGTPLASSAALRQAFEEAIDRVALDRVLYGGQMQVTCTPIAPANTVWYPGSRVPCTSYDPAHARKLVAASGIANPTVHVLVADATDDALLAQFIQAQEAAVGIAVVIDSTDAPTALARAEAGRFDVRIGGAVGNADPDWIISPFLRTGASRNYSGYSNPKLDRILSDALKATSLPARSALYRAAQRIILDERPVIVLFNPVAIGAFASSLAGVRLTYLGVLDVARAQYP
jgi:peptide/nickel transport system substrate-binding protein